MGRSDAFIGRCWQEWVDYGRFQSHDGSRRPRATADQGDKFIDRSAFTAPDSSLSTIKRTTRTRVSTMNIYRRLIERNLRSYGPLLLLPFTPAHCRARLQWCYNRLGWNHADWGRILFSEESRFHLRPHDPRRLVWRRPRQRVNPAFNIARHTGPQPGVVV
ncbi:HTH_Tnp_Tc3_2 domain-containing protein [Trichonephila clavipes]|nr:HTH_Tnp_Tc3_2 domain-containing protein [Trichonephila clavipes]